MYLRGNQQQKTISKCVKLAFSVALMGLLVFLSAQAYASDLPVTSAFGWRYHPISGEWSFHAGVDLGYAAGTPIPALFDGVVVQAGDYTDGYGNQVLLYHPAYDTYTRYAHMSDVYVTVDQYIPQGTVIGLVGATGRVTGAHLHLEYIVRGADGNYMYTDPLILWQ